MSFLNAKSQKESTPVLFFYLKKPLKHLLQLVQKKSPRWMTQFTSMNYSNQRGDYLFTPTT